MLDMGRQREFNDHIASAIYNQHIYNQPQPISTFMNSQNVLTTEPILSQPQTDQSVGGKQSSTSNILRIPNLDNAKQKAW